jgi:hypothetical protein
MQYKVSQLKYYIFDAAHKMRTVHHFFLLEFKLAKTLEENILGLTILVINASQLEGKF